MENRSVGPVRAYHDGTPTGDTGGITMRQRTTTRPQTALRRALDTLWLTLIAFAIGMAFRATVASAYEIPTPSMEPAIMTDDRVIAEKISRHFREPEVGDVVVIDNPVGGAIPFIKRVIALPGQTVDLRDGVVWVDGRPLDEPYTHGLPSEPLDFALPVAVPEGCVWVMGDNRTDSRDSRAFGPVPVDSIRGRALAVYWPPEHAHDLLGGD